MAVDVTPLSPLPRSFGPPPPGEQRPRLQRKHGRQYSVQLDIEQEPFGHEDVEEEQIIKQLPSEPTEGEEST